MAQAQGLDGIQMRGINDLALNYSKQQLAHLVQIGQLDPAKAMLAGMAIDRVKANAEKPPVSTVFDDVLGQQAQQPQDMAGIASMAPQQGQQPQPEQMPQEGAGVSALPSGIESMADGGIVGYADGGEVDGYAAGGVPKKSKYDELIYSAAQKANIDPEVFRRLIFTESSFNPNAVSYGGRDAGLGIAQISKHHKLTEAQRLDPKFSLGYAAKYFRSLVDRSEGDYRKALERYKGVASEKGRQRMAKAISTVLGEPYEASTTRLAAAAPAKQRKPKIDTIDNPFAVREEEIAQAPAPSGIAGLGDVNHLALLSTPYAQQNDYEMPEDAVGGFAGGGLAAFAGGGVPGYAGGDLVGQGFRKDQMLPPPSRGYGQNIIQRMQEAGIAVLEKNIADVEKRLATETDPKKRAYLADRKKALLAEQAAEKNPAPAPAPVVAQKPTAAAAAAATSEGPTTFPSATGGGDPVQQRIFAQERAGLVAAIAAEKNPANKARLQEDLAAIDREIAGLSKQSKTQPYSDGTGGRKDSVPNPFAPPSAGGAGAAPASPYNLPALSDPRYKVDVPTEAAPIPKVRSVKEITAEKTEAERDAGVDTEVYSKMVESIGKKREDLAGRKGEAIGEAIMMAGLKLMGARKGQEFKSLSEGAQEGLKQYAASMKEVKAAQDKYDERMDAYRLAENEAKRTGVTSALNTVEKEKDRLQAAEAENRKAKNRAAEVAATLGAGLKEADIRAMSALFGTQAKTGLTREEAMKMAMKSLADRGKINPTPAEIQAEMSKITSIYSGDAATPAAPTSVDYANKYGIAPTR